MPIRTEPIKISAVMRAPGRRYWLTGNAMSNRDHVSCPLSKASGARARSAMLHTANPSPQVTASSIYQLYTVGKVAERLRQNRAGGSADHIGRTTAAAWVAGVARAGHRMT